MACVLILFHAAVHGASGPDVAKRNADTLATQASGEGHEGGATSGGASRDLVALGGGVPRGGGHGKDAEVLSGAWDMCARLLSAGGTFPHRERERVSE